MSTIDPIFVSFRATFKRTDASVGETQRCIERHDATDVVPDALDSLNRKRGCVGEFLAVVRVVGDGYFLGPRIDKSEQGNLVIATTPIRGNVS